MEVYAQQKNSVERRTKIISVARTNIINFFSEEECGKYCALQKSSNNLSLSDILPPKLAVVKCKTMGDTFAIKCGEAK